MELSHSPPLSPLSQDFFVSIIFALAYFAPAVALAVYANEWDDLINSNRGAVFEGTLKETRNAVRAAAVSISLCVCVSFAILTDPFFCVCPHMHTY